MENQHSFHSSRETKRKEEGKQKGIKERESSCASLQDIGTRVWLGIGYRFLFQSGNDAATRQPKFFVFSSLFSFFVFLSSAAAFLNSCWACLTFSIPFFNSLSLSLSLSLSVCVCVALCADKKRISFQVFGSARICIIHSKDKSFSTYIFPDLSSQTHYSGSMFGCHLPNTRHLQCSSPVPEQSHFEDSEGHSSGKQHDKNTTKMLSDEEYKARLNKSWKLYKYESITGQG